jgi:hypothetical protein
MKPLGFKRLKANFFALCQVQVPDKRWARWLVITNSTPSSGKWWVWTNPEMMTGRGKPKCSKKVYHFASLPIRSRTWSAREYDMELRFKKVTSSRLCKSVTKECAQTAVPGAQLHWTNDSGVQCESELGKIGEIGEINFWQVKYSYMIKYVVKSRWHMRKN